MGESIFPGSEIRWKYGDEIGQAKSHLPLSQYGLEKSSLQQLPPPAPITNAVIGDIHAFRRNIQLLL